MEGHRTQRLYQMGRTTLHLLDVQTRNQDRAVCGQATYCILGEGDTAQKNVHLEEGHYIYFLDGGNKLGRDKDGTPHKLC